MKFPWQPGVWAAEAPGGRAVISPDADGGVVLNGTKYWCSGAATADHALLTAWEEDGSGPHLVAVALDQTGIAIDHDQWKAVGMAGSMSLNVAFDDVTARRVGKPGEYLSRPGFWHGGAGIAACWCGGAAGLAWALKKALLASPRDTGGYRMAALGKVELALQENAAVLRQSARWIDDYPTLDASHGTSDL